VQQTDVSAFTVRSFTGPLPDPDHLAGHEDALQGAADRIIRMAEKQVEHRQTIESHLVDSSIKLEARGQWLAFALGVLAITGGIFLVATGKSAEGLGTMITAVAVLVGVFIYAKREQQKATVNTGRRTLDPPQPEPPPSPEPPAWGNRSPVLDAAIMLCSRLPIRPTEFCKP